MRSPKPFERAVLASAGLLLLGQLLFAWNLGAFRSMVYDEAHYVPAARAILSGTLDARVEHPPLGKMLVALGMAIAGDTPAGWRLASSVFGSLTLLGMYLWSLALLGRPGVALGVALLTLFNHLLFVQARVAMLDVFSVCFMVWGLLALTLASRRERLSLPALAAGGVFFGLSVASKWVGLVPWALGAAALLRRGALARLALGLGVVPVATYFAVFALYQRLTGSYEGPFALLSAQAAMWDLLQRVPPVHAYKSSWHQWPLLTRPIWYAYKARDSRFSGIFLVGNPLIMVTGLAAVGYCGLDWLRSRSRAPFLIFFLYAGSMAFWIVFPRELSFYYYYFPSAMFLGPALGYALHKLESRWALPLFVAASAGVFVYFYPVLAALSRPAAELSRWMWLKSWI